MNTQVQSASENHAPSDFDEAIKAMGGIGNPEEEKEKEVEQEDPELALEKMEDEQAQKERQKEVKKEVKAPVAPKVELDPKKYNESLELKRKQFLAEKKWKQEKVQYDERIRKLEEMVNANNKQKSNQSRSENDIFDDIVNDPENKWLSPTEIKAKVKEELRDELKKEWQQEREQERAAQNQETEIAIFKEKINEHLEASPDTYPMINAMGYEDNVWDIIEQDYQRNVQELGEDYANDNIMSIEDAAKKVENYLAQQFRSRVQSKKIGKSLRSFLGDDGVEPSNSTQSLSPKTLTNDFSRNPSMADEGPENEQERLKWALKFVK